MDLVASLRKLPVKIRRAVVLHNLADMPVAETATDMRAAEGTVKTWLRRGRAELATHLAGYRTGHSEGGKP